MALGPGMVRRQFTLDAKMWKRLMKLKREMNIPATAYSAVVNQSLSTLVTVLEGARSVAGKGEVETRAEFYKIMSKVMGELSGDQLKL